MTQDTGHTGPAVNLDEIEARADRALPGPWEYVDGELLHVDGDERYVLYAPDEYGDDPLSGMHAPSMEFAAAARQDVPALVAEVRAHRAAADSIRDRIHRTADTFGGLVPGVTSHLIDGILYDLDTAHRP